MQLIEIHKDESQLVKGNYRIGTISSIQLKTLHSTCLWLIYLKLFGLI